MSSLPTPLSPRFSEYLLEAGCDEAGRGCLAGPVYAAAVILPGDFDPEGLTDSKLLTLKQRSYYREKIEAEALAWAVASVDNHIIDEINILNASITAMHLAIERLGVKPEFLLIDGNRFKAYQQVPHRCIIKGDRKYLNIAAASILAKTHRDQFMLELHRMYPAYGWQNNKGYPTASHRQAIAAHGITEHHRKSFRLGKQMELFS